MSSANVSFGFGNRAFLSHNHHDDLVVSEIARFLRGLGLTVFNDDASMGAGDSISATCESEIRSCEIFVLVHTKHSASSLWVTREVNLAVELGKRIIPIRLDDTPKRSELSDVLEVRFTGNLLASLGAFRQVIPRLIASSRILHHAPKELFGRDEWLDELDQVWNSRNSVNVYSLIAWGGVGKTSVVVHWVNQRLCARGWPGVARYFDWSFYSQGTQAQSQANAEPFIAAALEFFGDPDPQAGRPWERGQRLARLVRQHRTLLVLDGIEPLQYPPNSPQAGQFKDQAIEALLTALAQDNPGLVIITSRESLKNLDSFNGRTVEERKLTKLSKDAGIALLQRMNIIGSESEMEEAWRDAGGHALTLELLGRFLADAYRGDIRRRKEVKLEIADRETPGRTAMKVMLAYETWLESAGPNRQRDLAVLRLMGLFDRPADAECLNAVRTAPVIPGLTESIINLEDWEWNKAITDLEMIDLISVTANCVDQSIVVDTHPLVREFFEMRIRTGIPVSFQLAHSRIFKYLVDSTEKFPNSLQKLQPLYQAISHGCRAKKFGASLDVYQERILRREKRWMNNKKKETAAFSYYSTAQLGAIGSDLSAIWNFFDGDWNKPAANLGDSRKSWISNQAAFLLRAVGRLEEALKCAVTAYEIRRKLQQFEAATASSNLAAEILLIQGKIPKAISIAAQGLETSDLGSDDFQRVSIRSTLAFSYHAYGKTDKGESLFSDAEDIQRVSKPEFPILGSIAGYQFAELRLSQCDVAFWRSVLNPSVPYPLKSFTPLLQDLENRAKKELVSYRRGGFL